MAVQVVDKMVFNERIELLPEPDEPQMLTAVDRDAPGYPALDYGLEEWQDPPSRHDWFHPFRPPLPWGFVTLIAGLVMIVAFTPAIEALLFGPLIPDSEWAFEVTEIRTLGDEGLTGSGVNVCLVDTGIDISHPDLQSAKILGYLDLVTANNSVVIDHGGDYHGTMMAGILVADGELKGAAPNVRLSVAAALGMGGLAHGEQTIADAIHWCWSVMDADIISLSLGGIADPDMPLTGETVNAVNEALDLGIFIIAAAGNDGPGTADVSTPANIPGVIAVAALDKSGQIWVDSSSGSVNIGSTNESRTDPHKKPEVSAPGVDIISTSDPKQSVPYSLSSGTSDSTVFVTGALSLILERHSDALYSTHPDDGRARIDLVKTALMISSTEGSELGHNIRSGYGGLSAKQWESQVDILLTT